jgi:hypothetical protein
MEIYCELDRTLPGLPLKTGRCGTMTPDYKRNTWLHFSTWLQFNRIMTFDVLGQRLYGPPLRVTHNMPVLLKSSSGVAMTQPALYHRERWALHKQFGRGGVTESVQTRPLDLQLFERWPQPLFRDLANRIRIAISICEQMAI